MGKKVGLELGVVDGILLRDADGYSEGPCSTISMGSVMPEKDHLPSHFICSFPVGHRITSFMVFMPWLSPKKILSSLFPYLSVVCWYVDTSRNCVRVKPPLLVYSIAVAPIPY